MVKGLLKKYVKKIPPPLYFITLFIKLFLMGVITPITIANAEESAFNLPLFKTFQDKVYVSISPKEVKLGERITLTIKGESLQTSFEKIDWSQWKTHLMIEEVDIGFNRIKVRLYPFSQGTFQFSEQQAGRIKLPPFSLTVQPNPHVSIAWQRPPSSLYAQQNAPWKAHIWVQNPANKITLEAPKNTPKHITQIIRFSPLAIESAQAQAHPNKLGGKTETLIANYAMPTESIPSSESSESSESTQSITLPSPVVVIKNPSNQKWYFFDRPITTTIKPLPHFLPITVLVGQLHATPSPIRMLQEQGQLNYWTWQFIGQGISPSHLKQLANQLSQQIPYDAKIEWLTVSQEISHQWTEQGIQSTLTLRLPYRINQLGWVDFPMINLPFFNPESGKLDTFTWPAQSRLVLPFWLIVTLGVVLTFLTLTTLFWSIKRLKYPWLKQQLIKEIKQADNAETLWLILNHWSQKHPSPPMQTVGQWQKWCQQTYEKTKTPKPPHANRWTMAKVMPTDLREK
ncbi:hypothetical protein MNBD_GAMMA04-753 [hydrothermal vent metagenome]|uniref:BatD n=1 Tax=hydrothermal vent metagenome TaxID=652676 RepID=A0A3B0W252_9ZZZZ